ncbi:unnamed protein product [Rotaria sp. Silwood2]|nr:unnamed protein product [Rotaria sp. Silwood2]CAF4364827.1 unnamed protein product [Rotaria sp. Silwood2]
MPPRRGGGARGRRKIVQESFRTTTPTTNTIQTPSTTPEIQQQTNKIKLKFEVTPLIVETDSITKVKLNHIIKNYLADVKISNIQNNRPNSFILYPNDQHPNCCNCKGDHVATSTDCPKFKEYQQKIQRTINQFSSTIQHQHNTTSSICPNWNDLDEFPMLQTLDKVNKLPLIEIISEKIIAAVEQATEKIFQVLNRKFEMLTNHLSNKFNIEVEELLTEKNDYIPKNHGNTKTITQLRTTQEQPPIDANNEKEYSLITPNNENKKKFISPNSLMDKLQPNA